MNIIIEKTENQLLGYFYTDTPEKETAKNLYAEPCVVSTVGKSGKKTTKMKIELPQNYLIGIDEKSTGNPVIYHTDKENKWKLGNFIEYNENDESFFVLPDKGKTVISVPIILPFKGNESYLNTSDLPDSNKYMI